MTTESRKRKEVTPPLIPALPRDSVGLPSLMTGQGASASVQGIMGSKGSKVLFAISVAKGPAEAQRGLSFSNLCPQTIRKFGIPFILEVELHRNSLAAGWGLSFFFLLHFTELQPFFFDAEKDRAREAHKGSRNIPVPSPPLPGAPCSLSSLCRQVCEQHLGHQYCIYFYMVSKM